MRILAVSDKESQYIWDYFDAERFKDIDLVISCGDLKSEYLSYLVTMIKAPLFYVHGNHDTEYKESPPEGCTCIDGKLVSYNGIRILGLGGTYRYNGGQFQYTEAQMKSRVRKLYPSLIIKKGFDILVTHASAYGMEEDTDLCHKSFKCFTELLDRFSPAVQLHGHQHLSYKNRDRIMRYKDTSIINAYEYHILDYNK